MSDQLKVGDWVTVTDANYYGSNRQQYVCRVSKVLPSGSLKVGGQFSERSFKPPRWPGAPTYRANAELWLQPATGQHTPLIGISALPRISAGRGKGDAP